MRNALFAELRRAMNLLWIPAVLGVGFSICFDSWNDFLRSLSTGIGSVQYFFENSSFGGACRSYFLPVFTSLPFAASFCREYRDKAFPLIVYREGRKNYCLVKFFVNALCGGMTAALGTGLLFLLLAWRLPVADPRYMESAGVYQRLVSDSEPFHLWIAVHEPVLYFFVETASGFFRGVFWSSAALCVSVCFPDPFVTFLSPYLGSFLLIQAFRLLRLPPSFRLDFLIKGRMILRSSLWTLGICALAVAAASWIMWFFFCRQVYRRIREG